MTCYKTNQPTYLIITSIVVAHSFHLPPPHHLWSNYSFSPFLLHFFHSFLILFVIIIIIIIIIIISYTIISNTIISSIILYFYFSCFLNCIHVWSSFFSPTSGFDCSHLPSPKDITPSFYSNISWQRAWLGWLLWSQISQTPAPPSDKKMTFLLLMFPLLRKLPLLVPQIQQFSRQLTNFVSLNSVLSLLYPPSLSSWIITSIQSFYYMVSHSNCPHFFPFVLHPKGFYLFPCC